MRLIPTAMKTATRSYSMWANYLGILALITPEIIYWGWGMDTNPRGWWFAGLGLIIAGAVGRVVDQGISRSPALVGLLALLLALAAPHDAGAMSRVQTAPVVVSGEVSQADFLAVATPLVGRWEGKRNTAYLDSIASPPVWTVCFGETRGVKQGDTYTDAECATKLGKALLTYRAGLHGYFTAETRAGRLTPERDAAYVDLAYNVGISGAGNSTATRRLNAGDIAGGCAALGWWNKAGGRVVRGLVNRRGDDTRFCMIGVSA